MAENETQASASKDGILIEKDGQFQMVSLSDMQAQDETPEAEGESNGLKENDQYSESVIKQEPAKLSTTFDVHTTKEPLRKPEPRAPSIKSESTVSFALATTSTPKLTHNNQQKATMARTKSAPGYRFPSTEEELMKRERNEAAFRAWLVRKNREIAQQKQSELSKVRQSEEGMREKRNRNEAAYKAWLEYKNQEFIEQKSKEKSIRAASSISECPESEERGKVAFESWLSRKEEQKQKENDTKVRLKERDELCANKADPTIVQQAYKSWLHRKKAQARDEAIRKEQYRRKYYSQSRQLKQSLRFQGF